MGQRTKSKTNSLNRARRLFYLFNTVSLVRLKVTCACFYKLELLFLYVVSF